MVKKNGREKGEQGSEEGGREKYNFKGGRKGLWMTEDD